MINYNLIAYNDLAWTEDIVSSAEDHADEAAGYCRIIKDNSEIESKTLLHLGCGAGMYDYTLKKHFKVVGVDISKKMIDIAKNHNPEVTYICGDMRSIRLK